MLRSRTALVGFTSILSQVAVLGRYLLASTSASSRQFSRIASSVRYDYHDRHNTTYMAFSLPLRSRKERARRHRRLVGRASPFLVLATILFFKRAHACTDGSGSREALRVEFKQKITEKGGEEMILYPDLGSEGSESGNFFRYPLFYGMRVGTYVAGGNLG